MGKLTINKWAIYTIAMLNIVKLPGGIGEDGGNFHGKKTWESCGYMNRITGKIVGCVFWSMTMYDQYDLII